MSLHEIMIEGTLQAEGTLQLDSKPSLPALFVLGLLLFSAGCGGGSTSVSGDVSFDGKPLAAGNIRLDPVGETDATPTSTLIEDGKYTIADSELKPGKFHVSITATKKTGRTVKSFENLEGSTAQSKVDEVVQFIPPAYNRDTTLEVELIAGENAGKNFALSSRP